MKIAVKFAEGAIELGVATEVVTTHGNTREAVALRVDRVSRGRVYLTAIGAFEGGRILLGQVAKQIRIADGTVSVAFGQREVQIGSVVA